MYSRDELFLCSLQGYFDGYFPRCFATLEINTKRTLLCALKQFVTQVHTLFSVIKKMAKPSISEINILWWCCWNWSNIMLSHFADYLNFMCLHSQLSNWHLLILPVLEVINRFNINSPCQNWHWDNLIIAPLPLGKHWKLWVITKSTENLIIQLQQNKA